MTNSANLKVKRRNGNAGDEFAHILKKSIRNQRANLREITIKLKFVHAAPRRNTMKELHGNTRREGKRNKGIRLLQKASPLLTSITIQTLKSRVAKPDTA